MRRNISFAALALASAVLYLGFTFLTSHLSLFPLDDAWIHLTFARNLALRGELAFTPGVPSAGSTSPLWTFALAPGFWWPFGPEAWVFLAGVMLLFIGAWLLTDLAHILFSSRRMSTAAGVVFALEWHLNWAAYSGMETLLFIVLLLLMLRLYLRGQPLWWVALVAGLSVVTRPEGVGMFALIGAHALITRRRTSATELLAAGAAFALPIIPYLWFNWTTSGLLFPNTFYAKQAEYAEVFASTSLLARVAHLSTITFVGAQILLVPGFMYAAWLCVKERRWDAVILLGWWALLPFVYALRLPVDYQHARYEMPVIPMLLVLGLWGTQRIYAHLPQGALARVAGRAWLLTFTLLLAAFWGIGAQRRALDAATMDCLVVQPARWLGAHTPPSALIAAHDIGALGYYLNNRPLIDLAGLITPDVILFVRDEPRLMRYLVERHADYVVTSAAWHPQIIQDPRVQEVFHGDCALARREGGYELGIYRVISP